MDKERLNVLKAGDRSGDGNGLEILKDKENITSFHQNATASRHGTFS